MNIENSIVQKWSNTKFSSVADPDPTYSTMFLMLSKRNIFHGIFLPNPMTLKIKDKKIIWTKLYFQFHAKPSRSLTLLLKYWFFKYFRKFYN